MKLWVYFIPLAHSIQQLFDRGGRNTYTIYFTAPGRLSFHPFFFDQLVTMGASTDSCIPFNRLYGANTETQARKGEGASSLANVEGNRRLYCYNYAKTVLWSLFTLFSVFSNTVRYHTLCFLSSYNSRFSSNWRQRYFWSSSQQLMVYVLGVTSWNFDALYLRFGTAERLLIKIHGSIQLWTCSQSLKKFQWCIFPGHLK